MSLEEPLNTPIAVTPSGDVVLDVPGIEIMDLEGLVAETLEQHGVPAPFSEVLAVAAVATMRCHATPELLVHR